MSCFTPAEQAVMHIVKRMTADPRLAYLIGPGTESFDKLRAAAMHIVGDKGVEYQAGFLADIERQPLPGIGQAAGVIERELWAEILEVNANAVDVDQQISVDYLVNHFVRLGLRTRRAEVDACTEELF